MTQPFGLMNFIECVARSLQHSASSSTSIPWIESWCKGPIADPRLMVDVGNLLYRSVEARSPVLRTLEGIVEHHWPLTPVVKTALKGAGPMIQYEEKSVTYTIRIPTELMFRLTTSDWDTVLVHCLSSSPQPICKHILLFRNDQDLFDFVCDHGYTPDTVLEPALSKIHHLCIADTDTRCHATVSQRLQFMVNYARKHAPDAKLNEVGSILLLPTLQLLEIVDPIFDWENAVFTVPEPSDFTPYLCNAVATCIAQRFDRYQTPKAKSIASTIYDLVLSKDFSTKMDLTE